MPTTTVTETPSGRKLRDIQGWMDSGVQLSSRSDKAAMLLDMSAEMILGVFGEPFKYAKDAADEDETCAIPVCVMLWLLLLGTSGKRGDQGVADLVARMDKAVAAATHTARELVLVEAFRELSNGHSEACLDLVEKAITYAPGDAMLLKLQNDLCYFLGQSQRMRDGVTRALPFMAADTTPMYSYVVGMHAFALEECFQYEQALDMADKALQLHTRDPWAIHAKSHVFEMQGRADENQSFLQELKHAWGDSNLRCHLHWHAGLSILDHGDVSAALNHYDTVLAPHIGQLGVFALVDCTQFLQRMELDGADVGWRWEGVVPGWLPHLADHRLPFNDCHIALAACASNDAGLREQALREMQSFLADANNHDTTSYMILSQLGIGLVKGFTAMREKRYAEAVNHLLPIRYKIHLLGGSVAQRDVVALILLHAAMLANDDFHRNLAKQIVNERASTGTKCQMVKRLMAKVE